MLFRYLHHLARIPTTFRRSSTLTNFLASETPPPVQVSTITPDGIHLANGVLLPSACIFLHGNVFLWEVPPKLWDGWTRDQFEIFETVAPRPELLLLGTGKSVALVPPALRSFVNGLGIQLDVMDTRNACSTYNLLSEEGRYVAAALLPLSHRSWRTGS